MSLLCRLLHKWGKWGEPHQTTVSYRQIYGEYSEHTSTVLAQRRTCERCGAVDYRKVPLS